MQQKKFQKDVREMQETSKMKCSMGRNNKMLKKNAMMSQNDATNEKGTKEMGCDAQ